MTVLADLEASFASRPGLAEEIDTIALSVVVSDVPEARLRIGCWDEEGAQHVAFALRTLRLFNQYRQDDERLEEALEATRISRSGHYVEATVVDAAGLVHSMLAERAQ